MAEYELKCNMTSKCGENVTHIDNKGWIYCETHGISRNNVRPCRRLTKDELVLLMQGKPVPKF